jgi:hypothetical protein
MLANHQHLFDEATRVTAGDSRWQGRTSEDYWAFVGPFGGATAATILRALIDHPQRSGDPLSLLAVADGKVFHIFHKSYGDQSGELWSPNGRLLATTHQIAYFKA